MLGLGALSAVRRPPGAAPLLTFALATSPRDRDDPTLAIHDDRAVLRPTAPRGKDQGRYGLRLPMTLHRCRQIAIGGEVTVDQDECA